MPDITIEEFKNGETTLHPADSSVRNITIGDSKMEAVRFYVYIEEYYGHLDIYTDDKNNGFWRFTEFKVENGLDYFRKNMNSFITKGVAITNKKLLQYISNLVSKYHAINKTVELDRWIIAESVPSYVKDNPHLRDRSESLGK